ncbi:MAG TPA: DUF1579 domain-containing protein [Gemmataceae bacterium]|nr:DUF1579 domain-containing protein [Gemmataceae bacterium]
MRTTLLTALACVVWFQALPAKAQEMPKPGPEQEKLHQFVGDWDVTISMAGQEMKGTATYKMGLGNFFLFEEFQGDLGGMKFHGKGMTGYDPLRKTYIATWADSMSPSLMVMHGHFSNDGKTYTEEGEGPGMDGKLTKMKSVVQLKEKDHFVFTMYTVADGKDTEMMKLTYTRKK